MKVLIACEYSGIVRDAFKACGHDAWSCDILPTESKGNHIQGDVLEVLDDGWDLMIGHPPCTYLSYAGTRHWNNEGRLENRLKALEFFGKLWLAPIGKICLENPKGCASPTIAKYSQEIQPYYFGDDALKTTWLWLKNLPKLRYKLEEDLFSTKTGISKPEPLSIQENGKKRYFSDSKIRCQKKRSKFWPGIARAMAEQWGME